MTNIEKKWVKLENRTMKVLKSAAKTCNEDSNKSILNSYLGYVQLAMDECRRFEVSKLEGTELNHQDDLDKLLDELLDMQLKISEFLSCKPDSRSESFVKLPRVTIREFDTTNPSIWFQDLEIQFAALAVKEEKQRFAILNGLLDQPKSLVIHPVTDDLNHDFPYTAAKTLLLDSYSLSLDQRLEKAFELQLVVGNEKPSQFLARFRILRNLAQMDDIDQWFLRRVLPEDVRLTLRNDDSITCAEDLAIKADQLLQSKQFQPTSINFVSKRTNKFPSRVKKLCYFHEKEGKDSKRCAGTPIEKCSMWYLVNPSSERKRQAVERVTVLSASISNPQSGTHLVVDGFVVDTGSKITVVPKSFSNKILINKPIPLLSAANGSSIKTFGHCKISPMILGKPYEFLAVVADVSTPILGLDFFSSVGSNILIDPSNQSLHLKKQVLSISNQDPSLEDLQVLQAANIDMISYDVLPNPKVFLQEQNDDVDLQKWIKKHSCQESKFVPSLVPCADIPNVQVWADCSSFPFRILVPTSWSLQDPYSTSM